MAWAEKIFFQSDGFTLDVPQWEFPDEGITCVLGESGSGKSTLLQCLAGLIPCRGLKLSLQKELVSDLPPRDRNFGFVFQDYALFPHMTAWENIAFAPQAKNLPPDMWTPSAEKLLKRLKLERVVNQKASVLSGGEQQRVALARALVTKPRLVLMDEPLSALDEKIRDEARLLIAELSDEYKVPFLFVTHDLRDVRALSKSVLILAQGKTLASGLTETILSRPPNFEAAAAIAENQIIPVDVSGSQVLLEGRVVLSGELKDPTQIRQLATPQLSDQSLGHSSPQSSPQATGQIDEPSGKSYLVAKAWSFELVPKGEGTLSGTVIRSSHEGHRWQCLVQLASGPTLKAWSQLDVKPMTDMDLKIDTSSVMLFKGGSP